MTTTATDGPTPPASVSSRRGSAMVGAGILASRAAGFVRLRVFGYYFGAGPLADAFNVAFRIPNIMQNLLGEGVLSASFIPVHARLLAAGRREEAGRVAGAVLGLLAMAAGVVSLLGVLFADPLTSLVAPGFDGAKRELTVTLIRVVTPGIGLLVLSAWCLGVLNSHRRFFLSYVAPVLWNAVQIAALVGAAVFLLDPPLLVSGATGGELERLVIALAIGTVVGGLAQLLVQVPAVRRLEPDLRPSLRRDLPGVRRILRAAGPVVAGRGVVQLATYVDVLLASLLATGAVSVLMYAQQLYLLPISLFGMSVAAAELPELSAMDHGDVERMAARVDDGLARVAFYVAATAVAYLVIGDLIIATLFRTGAFDVATVHVVWFVLGAFAVGLVATTSSRLLQSLLYGIGDTRTPAIVSIVRVAIAIVVGGLLMFQLDRFTLVGPGIRQLGPLPAFGPVDDSLRAGDAGTLLRLGAVGLAVAAGLGAWVEWRLLRAKVRARFGVAPRIGGPGRASLVVPLAVAAVVGLAARWLVSPLPVLARGVVAAALVGLAYIFTCEHRGVEEADVLIKTVAPRLGRPGQVIMLWRASLHRRQRLQASVGADDG